jgi:hypothetical protein
LLVCLVDEFNKLILVFDTEHLNVDHVVQLGVGPETLFRLDAALLKVVGFVVEFSVVEFSVVEFSVVELFVVELSVVELAVVELAVVELAVFELAVFELNVIELNVVELAVVELTVVELTVVELTVVELSVLELLVVDCEIELGVTILHQDSYATGFLIKSVLDKVLLTKSELTSLEFSLVNEQQLSVSFTWPSI